MTLRRLMSFTRYITLDIPQIGGFEFHIYICISTMRIMDYAMILFYELTTVILIYTDQKTYTQVVSKLTFSIICFDYVRYNKGSF